MGKIEKYDAIVIGAGQGGGPLAGSLADNGWKTAIIERKFVGGTCINYGCTPTKTLIASGRVAYLVKRAKEYGINIRDYSIDLNTIMKRKNDIVQMFRNGSQKALEGKNNLTLIFGRAEFTSSKTINVEGRVLEADKIFINTGARPHIPQIPGINQVPYLTSTTLMELQAIPEHLIVLGAGYIAVEFSQFFRRLGSKVTMINRSSRLVKREEEELTDELLKIFTEDGIEMLPNEKLKSVENGVSVNLESGKKISGSHLFIATGRTPNTDDLGLENTQIKVTSRGHIEVNQYLETSESGVYALGDAKPGPAFTHISYDDYRILRDNLLNGTKHSITNRQVPSTIFTDPQLARIGMTQKDAKDAGKKIRVAKLPMNWVARALEVDESRGLIKAIVDGETDEILGFSVLGIEGGELMTVVQMAMKGGVKASQIREMTFAHPTLSECLNNVFNKLEDA